MCLPPDCCIGMRSSSRMCSHPPSSATYTARCRRRHLLCRPAAARPAGRPGSGRGAAAAAARAAGPGLPAVRGGGRMTPGGWHVCVHMQLPWIAGKREQSLDATNPSSSARPSIICRPPSPALSLTCSRPKQGRRPLDGAVPQVLLRRPRPPLANAAVPRVWCQPAAAAASS